MNAHTCSRLAATKTQGGSFGSLGKTIFHRVSASPCNAYPRIPPENTAPLPIEGCRQWCIIIATTTPPRGVVMVVHSRSHAKKPFQCQTRERGKRRGPPDRHVPFGRRRIFCTPKVAPPTLLNRHALQLTTEVEVVKHDNRIQRGKFTHLRTL